MTLAAEPHHGPRLADGVELIGEYQGSGYQETRYLVKRSDGQMVVLSQLLFLVALRLTQTSDTRVVAKRVSDDYGRGVSPDNVEYLVEKRLRPLGIIAPDPGATTNTVTPTKPRNDLLHLTARARVMPPGMVNAAANALHGLFAPPIVVAVLITIVLANAWLIGHGIGGALEATLMEPLWLLLIIGGIVVSSLFHELGHAAACRYGGARPGVIGAGIYLIWPAFYTDVTDSYRLNRAGRLRTDLGGIYFNVIFALGTYGAYAVTGWEPLLVLVLFQHIEIVHQFMPVVRLDGYYVVSDLAGVPDLFNRVGPIARSIGRRRADPALSTLRPRARRIVVCWLAITAPVLAFNLVLLVIHAPRIYGTSGRSVATQAQSFWDAVGLGAWPVAALAVVSILLLALPVVGITIIFTKLGRRLGTATFRWAHQRPAPRVPVVAVVGAGLAFLLAQTWG